MGLFLVLIAINHHWLNAWYLPLFYDPFSAFQRWTFGRLPFSVGDTILYGVLIFVAYRFFRWLVGKMKQRQKQAIQQSMRWKAVMHYLNGILAIILVFYLFWGLNYFRPTIRQEMVFDFAKPDQGQLVELNRKLLDSVHAYYASSQSARGGLFMKDSLFFFASKCFAKEQTRFDNWILETNSLKYSMWSWLGDLTGVAGYYNPFTGEAQLNRNLPVFLKPFVACHELAHQLGYANESEANFVGYLTCRQSTHPLFRYAAHLEMLMLANRQLRLTDPAAAETVLKQCQTGVQTDLQTWKNYQGKQSRLLESLFETVFDIFLKTNRQEDGIRSYDAAVMLYLAYERQYGS